jgi:two-component system NarL family sensor kinase
MSMRIAAGAPATAENPPAGVQRIVAEHEQRGISLQIAIRGVLALFVVGTLLLLPPEVGGRACALIAGAYVVAAVVLTVWLRTGRRSAVSWGWLGLYVDLLVLSALCLIAGQSSVQSWTAYVLLGGFFLLPVLAATQLHWWVCASVVVPTVLFYAIEAFATQDANAEPLASIVLRVLVLAGVGVAAIGLSRIQRSRVSAISGLVSDRTELLTELMSVTDSERRTLAESLHDGALQYILAARMDLEDAREDADPHAFDRLDQALTESSQLLRSTVSELHPAVLAQSGLADALGRLARAAADRGGLDLTLDTAGWPADARTGSDLLLFGTARELLANVVRHAQASRLRVFLDLRAGTATLEITDDGIGTDTTTVAGRLAAGHIGLNSHRVRIESAGGQFRLDTPESGGTRIRISVPVQQSGQ